MPTQTWTVGDTVRHAARPEWGQGKVSKAEATVHEGKPCQRLTIKFDRAGLKTLSTAFAELEPFGAGPLSGARRAAGVEQSVSSATSASTSVVNDAFELPSESIAEVLARLPDAASDPFRTLEARLKATLSLYRFQATGSSLLDWAASQSGITDPLSKFSRHELEAHFQRFRVRLDAHLVTLARDAAKADPAMLTRLKADAPSQARSALDRLNTRR